MYKVIGMRCPKCGSPNVWKNLVTGEYTCLNCGYHWKVLTHPPPPWVKPLPTDLTLASITHLYNDYDKTLEDFITQVCKDLKIQPPHAFTMPYRYGIDKIKENAYFIGLNNGWIIAWDGSTIIDILHEIAHCQQWHRYGHEDFLQRTLNPTLEEQLEKEAEENAKKWLPKYEELWNKIIEPFRVKALKIPPKLKLKWIKRNWERLEEILRFLHSEEAFS